MGKNIYIFSGLGADERVFRKLDLSGLSVTFINWIAPEIQEAIEQYAVRISSQIKAEKPILVGLSFGGMMAVEVAKHIETEKVILIASAKNRKEIPFYYRFAGFLKLHKLVPTSVLKQASFLTDWFFGAKAKSDKLLLKEILRDTDPKFLTWAIDKIVCWKNKQLPENVFHLHGSSDKILPIAFVKCDLVIKEGGHLMTLDKSEEVSAVLRQQLK